MGSIAGTLGKYPEAIDYYEQALAIFERKLGLKHPNTLAVKNNLELAREEAARHKPWLNFAVVCDDPAQASVADPHPNFYNLI